MNSPRHSGRMVAALLAGLAVWPLGLDAQPSPAASGASDSRRVAVTFDDVPANIFRGDLATYREVTARLLAAIGRADVPAIGFVNESKLVADGAPDGSVGTTVDPGRVELLQAWIDAGLELGNHTCSHPDLHDTPLETFQADVLRGERVTRELLASAGRELRFFRHPFLHTGRDLETKHAFERFLDEHGYRVAPVTIDNQEWIFARAYDHAHVREDEGLKQRVAEAYVSYMDSIFGYYESQSKALLGYELPQVLLLHANRLNAETWDRLVEVIRGRGYSFIKLDEVLEDAAYRLPDEYTGPAGITWLHRWALTQGKRGEFFAGEPDVPGFVRDVFEQPPEY